MRQPDIGILRWLLLGRGGKIAENSIPIRCRDDMNFNPTYHTYSAGKKLTWEPVVWKSREQSMFMEMVFPGTIQKAELEKRRAGFLGMPLEEYKAQAGNPDGL